MGDVLDRGVEQAGAQALEQALQRQKGAREPVPGALEAAARPVQQGLDLGLGEVHLGRDLGVGVAELVAQHDR